MIAWTCVQNMIQVKSEKRNPSNTAKTMEIKISGAGKMASQPVMERTRSVSVVLMQHEMSRDITKRLQGLA